jgi:nitronate monooxygenase
MAQIASSSPVQAFFGAHLPVLQAGMGGVAQPELAAAVCEAGAFGMIGLYRHTRDEIGELLAQTAALTRARFGVNLVPFVLDGDALLDRLAYVADRPERPIVTFFGLPASAVLRALPTGMEYGVQGGTWDELEAGFDAGARFGVLQTTEAGGHHLGKIAREQALDQAARLGVDKRMVFLSGGISNSAELRRVLQAGFSGVLCGTVFAATRESAAHARYKQAIVDAVPGDTVVTDRFSVGWHTHRHRVIRNASCEGSLPASVIGFAHYFGKRYPILRYSVAVPTVQTEGLIEDMALYCGTSCKDTHSIRTVRQVLADLTA